MKVVFVCGGNTCRSPMAAAIAQHLLGPSLDIESAGIAPHGDSATSDAVAVAKDLFGIDLSWHQPKEVAPDSLTTSDYVVALDSYVATHLREDYGIASGQLIQWEIADPYLLGREAYARCARDIEIEVRGLTQQLAALERPAWRAESVAPRPQPAALDDLIGSLRQDLERWKDEVSNGTIRGTTLHGIAKKAADTFEVILRETVDAYRALVADGERAATEPSTGKPFERLTLGELVQFLQQNSQRLTTEARRTPNGATLFKHRTVVGPISYLLDSISRRRNDLHHRPQQFAPDTGTLRMNTTDLLNSLSKALADPLFEYTAVKKRQVREA